MNLQYPLPLKPARSWVGWAMAFLLPIQLFASTPPSDLDNMFLQARQAYARGDRQTLLSLAPALSNYSLKPYVDYWIARQYLDDDPALAQHFLATYSDTWLYEKLLREMATNLKLKDRNAEFLSLFNKIQRPDDTLLCASWSVLPVLSADQKQQLMDRWLRNRPLPDACYALAHPALGLLSPLDMRKRLWILLSEGMQQEAQKLSTLAFGDLGNLSAIQRKPDLEIRSSKTSENGQLRVSVALLALARNDVLAATQYWQTLQYRYSTLERYALWAVLGNMASRRLLPQATDLFAEAGGMLSDDQWNGYARSALRAQNWTLLSTVIRRMSNPLQETSRWTYWLGMANYKTGRAALARELWGKIAGQRNYYSLLALEHLGHRARLDAPAQPRQANELARASAIPCVGRALTLANLQLVESDAEWSWCLQSMQQREDDRTILAAADLANRLGQFHMAILAAESTSRQTDWGLRFPQPAPYQDWINQGVRQADLSAPQVYSLIRQESRFRPVARSWAGARGLMQIMPTTGRGIAKKINQRYHPDILEDPETNIRFGISYLRDMQDIFDHQPLVTTAAYNAGPNNAKRWLQPLQAPMDGAIFVATIPLAETRDYVEKIFYSIVFYQLLEGTSSASLTNLLVPVRPIAPIASADSGE